MCSDQCCQATLQFGPNPVVPVLQDEIRCPIVTEMCVYVWRSMIYHQGAESRAVDIWPQIEIWNNWLWINNPTQNLAAYRGARTWQITSPNCPSTRWITHTHPVQCSSCTSPFLLCARQSSIKPFFSAVISFSDSLLSIYVFQTLISFYSFHLIILCVRLF